MSKNNSKNIFVLNKNQPKPVKNTVETKTSKNTEKRIRYVDSAIPSIPSSIKIEFPKSNVKILIDKTVNISDKKILVLSLTRNCSYSIVYIEKFIKDLILVFGDNVKFCFFSNNNVDNTFSLLDDLSKKYGEQISIVKHRNENITKDNRISRFATYRNIVTKQGFEIFGEDFDYVIVFDSDLHDVIPIDAVVDSLKIKSPNWSCVSGNHCYFASSYYYDELALRFHNDPIGIKEKFTKFDEFYGHSEHWLDKLHIINEYLDVKSAFGGLCIYKGPEIVNLLKTGDLYNISNMPEYTAEHIPLNLRLKNKILINPNIKYTNSINLEGKMYNTPIAFVPRDAGFFSVFNFYMGCLASGIRAYPFFNKDVFLKMNNNKNEHFCYWTDKENCWFDYFEPVSFFDNDNNHIDGKYKMFPKHKGELAPVEFRIPKDTHNLIQDKERFKEWRKYVNNFYKHHIRYSKTILSKVDEFFAKNFNLSEPIIGVHYRHPSHFVESGKVYLEQYFSKIDAILKDRPNSQIFLATDSNFGIYAFSERYKNKIKFIDDIERLSMSEFLQWCFSLADGKADEVGFINGKGFELHHKRVSEPDNKKLTIDLLSEVICLSKCNYLVHTTSNIALAISYMNPDLELISL